MYVLPYYLQTNIVCIIILAMIFFKLINKTKYTTLIYKKIIISLILFCVVDIISILFRGSNFQYSNTILLISNSLYLFFPLLISFYWTEYVFLNIDKDSLKNIKIKILINLPVLIGVLLLILNIFTGILFTINTNNLYERSDISFIYTFVTWVYILISTIKSLQVYYTTDNIYKKEIIFPFCLFIIGPFVANLIQLFNYGLTVLQVGFTISSLMIFLYFQEEQISVDDLTKTNNRNKFNEYLQYKFENSKENDLISLMFIDVDDFKIINDTYGHLAGDDILVLIANILKKSCADFGKNLFLARYGGDEFVIVSNFDNDQMNELESIITNNIKKENNESIKISMGYFSDVRANIKSVNTLITKADNLMYENKRRKKKLSK